MYFILRKMLYLFYLFFVYYKKRFRLKDEHGRLNNKNTISGSNTMLVKDGALATRTGGCEFEPPPGF